MCSSQVVFWRKPIVRGFLTCQGLSSVWGETAFVSETVWGSHSLYEKTEHSKHDFLFLLSSFTSSFDGYGYIFLASMNPGPPTEFWWRKKGCQNFCFFNSWITCEVDEAIDPTHMHLLLLPFFSFIQSLLIHSRNKSTDIVRSYGWIGTDPYLSMKWNERLFLVASAGKSNRSVRSQERGLVVTRKTSK